MRPEPFDKLRTALSKRAELRSASAQQHTDSQAKHDES